MNQFCRIENPVVFPAKFSNQTLYFCRDCQELYKNKRCCYFCAQVYAEDNENFLDGQKWIMCDLDRCQKWTHLDCEGKNGIVEIEYMIEDPKYKYSCPWCRIEDQIRKPKFIMDKKHRKLQKYIKQRKSSTYETPIYQKQQSYLDELLKKNVVVDLGGILVRSTENDFYIEIMKYINNKMQQGTEVKLKNSKERSYFNQLVDAFIRPPRQVYETNKLGPSTLLVNKLLICREDFVVISRKEEIKLQCSIYTPVYLKEKTRACVFYLHGNSSSRLESSCYAHMFAAEGISLVNFDFGGCGISEGKYVTLGWYEKVDFMAVLDWVKKKYPLLGPFGVWGRSMGAVTAVMGGIERNDLKIFVLDSPFSNLKQLCIDIGDNFHVPQIGVRLVFYLLRKKVRQLAQYDPKHINSLQFIQKLSNKCSIMFVRGSGDKMVGYNHVEHLYETFKGEKLIVTFPGDHNSGRPLEVYSMIVKFFATRLNEKDIQSIIPKKIGSRKSSSKLLEIQQSKYRNYSIDSDLNYNESDDEKASRQDPDKYFPEIRKPKQFTDESENDSEHEFRYDEELEDHEIPQFQNIRTKHN